MHRHLTTLLLTFMVAMLSGLPTFAGPGKTDPKQEAYISDEVLALADSLPHAQEIGLLYELQLKSFEQGIAVYYTHDAEEAVLESQDIQAQGLSAYAHIPSLSYNYIYTTFGAPDNDSLSAFTTSQWHHDEMETQRAWDITKGAGVVAAVIDTGIDTQHPAFAGRVSAKSYNAFTGQIGLEYVHDDYGHGTHVAGILAAAPMDNFYGVAPEVEIMAIKADIYLMPGYFDMASLLRGINYAAENGADIINMSLGRDYAAGPDAAEHEVIAHAASKGITIICAAGNSSKDNAAFPAAYPEAIAVSALKQGGILDFYSNYGPQIAVSAPGSAIISTKTGGGYIAYSGTSMAAPNVAGVAALIKSLNPGYTNEQVRQALCDTAQFVGIEPGWNRDYGHGMAHPYAAVLGKDGLHTVTFDYNYGTREPAVIRIIPGNTINMLENGGRDGYVVELWEKDGNPFDFASPINADIRLTARWVPILPDMYAGAFPDNVFRHAILQLLNGTDGGKRASASPLTDTDTALLASITTLDISARKIRSVAGLQYLTGLTTLDCSNNLLTELDVSKNTLLSGALVGWDVGIDGDLTFTVDTVKGLDCSRNQLKTLNIAANTQLKVLNVSENPIEYLNIAGHPSLEVLDCNWTSLAILDVSDCAALKVISANCLNLLDIKLSGCTALEWLDISWTDLPIVDVSDCVALEAFYGGRNNATKDVGPVSFPHNPNLKILMCTGKIQSLDLSHNPKLEVLDFWGSNLKSIDLSKNPALKYINASYNDLTSLDISNNTALEVLYCYTNYLSSLVTGGKQYPLTQLNCGANRFIQMDLAPFPALELLDCSDNQITSLDLTRVPNLMHLNAKNNALTALDISANAKFGEYRNIYKENEISYFQYEFLLGLLDVRYNYIPDATSITGWAANPFFVIDETLLFNPQRGNNNPTGKDITAVFTDANFLAAVRQVAAKPTGPILDYDVASIRTLDIRNRNIKNVDGLEYFNALEILLCQGNQITTLDVTPNTFLRQLDCYENQLTSLTIANPYLWWVSCRDNQLTELDTTGNPALLSLRAGQNRLTKLITGNPLLESLTCDGNQLTELDISNNPALFALVVSYNKLTHIDITKNELQLYYLEGNLFTTLDLSSQPWLMSLSCGRNQLTSLDLSNNPLLNSVNCFSNQLTGLDITANIMLWSLRCYDNYMTSPDAVVGWKNRFNEAGSSSVDSFWFYPQKDTEITRRDKIEAFVKRLYVMALMRPADAEGVKFWSDGLENGTETAASVVDEFLFGPEFWGADKEEEAYEIGDEAFVTICYMVFFNRRPEAEGLEFWMNTLATAYNHRYVVDQMLMSPEFAAICAESEIELGPVSGLGGFVSRMYRNVLGRRYDQPGLESWVNGLLSGAETGATIAEEFFFSPEFLNRPNITDLVFIEIAYNSMMGRDSDTQGRLHWFAALQNGASRRDVLAEMVASAEFDTICKHFGITVGTLRREASDASAVEVDIVEIEDVEDIEDIVEIEDIAEDVEADMLIKEEPEEE